MIRRARPDDVDFLAELYADPEVRPFLAGGHDFGRESVAAEVERSERAPDAFGLFVIEVDGERAGARTRPRASSSGTCCSRRGSTGSSWRSTVSTSVRRPMPSARVSSAKAS